VPRRRGLPAKVGPKGDWYVRAWVGMALVLRRAKEKWAYTLTHRGTFLAQRQGPDLATLSGGDRRRVNRYSAILISAPSPAPDTVQGNMCGRSTFGPCALRSPSTI
jgi:ABC-type tungstate transport system permease subunit